MAGILDTKTRVMDTLVTSEGRRQIASGELRIEYASFTDRQIFYSSGSSGFLEDQGGRIYFEAYSDNNDKIIIESDGDGNLEPFKSDEYSSYGGSFYTSGSKATPETGVIDMISTEVANNATLSFQRQMIIGSRDLNLRDKSTGFTVTPTRADFFISDTSPFNKSTEVYRAKVDDIESVFQDFRIANKDNFKFLPPTTRPMGAKHNKKELATYTQITQDPLDTWEEMEEFLEGKQSQVFSFTESSRTSNIIGQIFEQHGNELEKLALIDMGEFSVEGSVNPHVLFAGKLYRDSRGSLTFANLFTLVFEK